MLIIRIEMPLPQNKPFFENATEISGKDIMDLYIRTGIFPKEFIYANDPRIENDKLVFELMIANPENKVIKCSVTEIPIEGSDYELIFNEQSLMKG